jgi:hypothetical protein
MQENHIDKKEATSPVLFVVRRMISSPSYKFFSKDISRKWPPMQGRF